MNFDIEAQAQDAQAGLQAAIVALNVARDAYHGGPALAYAQALDRHNELCRKIAVAEHEAEHAEADFKREFVASGYEKTSSVRAALASKNDALAMADEMRDALTQIKRDMGVHALAASTQGRHYLYAYEVAYAAYVEAEAFHALANAGTSIARAMALAAHAPRAHGQQEDSMGRRPATEGMAAETIQARWAFMLRALEGMARLQPEYGSRPDVPELGVLDFGALSPGDWVSPGQAHQLKHAHAREAIAM